MKSRLIEIRSENVDMAWGDAAPYIEAALINTPEYLSVDVYRELRNGELTLWMFYNDVEKKSFGAMVTQLARHPQMKILVIFLLAADDFEMVRPLFASFVEHAIKAGAAAIEFYGRFGLEKLVEDLGFKKSYIAMRFDVN